MQPMSQPELEELCKHLEEKMTGAQLQEVWVNDTGLLFQFYLRGLHFLLLDLGQQCPMLMDFAERPVFIKGRPKPVSLFLNSHGLDLLWKAIVLKPEYGRVLEVHLGNQQKSLVLEIRLIPKQANLILESEAKTISWLRPKELDHHTSEVKGLVRPLDVIREEYLDQKKANKVTNADPVLKWEKQRRKNIDKKIKALDSLEEMKVSQEEEKWRSLGGWLQYPQGDCPDEKLFLKIKDLPKAQQVQACFDKAKQIVHKRQGQSERIEILKKEIQELEKQKYKAPNLQKTQKDFMVAAKASGRTLELSANLKAYLGKSAADNLSLLRKARAWDLWFHLKDYPGAHAIIHKEKGHEVSLAEVQKVAQWVARESLQKKSLDLGQKLAVVVVECRFVRPIKGDRLGRVNYHSEKTYYVTL
jgi:predicted ribosome quality control (RQC) complex YloA/Tae2 family protein